MPGQEVGLAIRRLMTYFWFFAGMLLLVVLFFPGSMILDILQIRGDVPFGNPEGSILIGLSSLALILAASFLSFALDRFNEHQVADEKVAAGSGIHFRGARWAILALLLGALLFIKSLHSFYWLMVWDTTYDPLGYLYLILLFPAVIIAGIVQSLLLPFRKKWMGMVFFLVVSATLVASSALAQRVDYRQLTEERAGRVTQKVEAYYSRQGRFPQNLSMLFPGYALSLPGPFIIYGQGWCYDGGEDYYRLGYVYREHWSDPRLSGRIYKMVGEAPDLRPVCEQEIQAVQERYPDYPFSYQMDVDNQ